MKVVSSTNNGGLQRANLPGPIPARGEALVQLQYAGLNHLDLWTVRNRNQTIPGSDGAGIIRAVGEGISNTMIGREVIINPGIGWGDNERFALDSFDIIGTSGIGTLAEFIAVPVENLFDRPVHLSMQEAAVIPMAGLTAFRGLFVQGQLSRSDRVFITGIGGGVALMALQFAVAAGAAVYVTSSSDEKISHAVSLGATAGYNYTEQAWAEKAKTEVGGFNLILDSAAGKGLASLTEITAPAGRIVLFGRTAGLITQLDPSVIFNKQLSIIGTLMGSNQDFRNMVRFCDLHKIRPVIDSQFSLDDIDSAFDRLRHPGHFGKVSIAIAGNT